MRASRSLSVWSGSLRGCVTFAAGSPRICLFGAPVGGGVVDLGVS